MVRIRSLTGPSSLCEWAVGTTISSVLGPIPEKSTRQRRRDVIKVEVTTDDESEADTLKITYPRSRRSDAQAISRRPKSKASIKKVRFEEQNLGSLPRKSALKKSRSVTFEPGSGESGTSDSETEELTESSESETESSESTSRAKKGKNKAKKSTISETESDMSGFTTSSAADNETSASESDAPVKSNNKKNPEKQKKKTETMTSSESESESDVSANAKNQKQAKAAKKKKKGGNTSSGSEADGETSESEVDTAPKSKNVQTGKKGKASAKKVVISDTEGGTEESEIESEEHQKAATGKKKQQGGHNKNKTEPAKEGKNEKKQQNAKKGGKKNKAESEGEDGETDPDQLESAQEGGGKQKKKGSGQKGSQHHSPPLLEPVQSQMVQTERVVETQDDAPRNAYFDGNNNVLRVYYAPVQGERPDGSLYPHRMSTIPQHQPPPMAMPHMAPNGFFQGTQGHLQQPQPGYGHVPITQGISVGPWNAVCPPPDAYHQGYMSGHPPTYRPGQHNISQLDSTTTQSNGAFMSGANGQTQPSPEKDADHLDSGKKKRENPYRVKSLFSKYAEDAASNKEGSQKTWSQGGGSQKGAWHNHNWTTGSNRSFNQNNSRAGNSSSHSRQNNGENWGSGTGNWNNTQNPPANQQDTGGQSSWEPMGQDNNVAPNGSMPGSYPAVAQSTPAWGDPTAAADTGGNTVW